MEAKVYKYVIYKGCDKWKVELNCVLFRCEKMFMQHLFSEHSKQYHAVHAL